MNLVKGEAEVFPKQGKSFDPALIRKAVSDAGFTASEIVVTAAGTLAQEGEALQLKVPGLLHLFVLAGGAQAPGLGNRPDIISKKVLVTGKLHPSQADAPPSLTVERFHIVP